MNKKKFEFVQELRIFSPEISFSVRGEMKVNEKSLDNVSSPTGIGIPHQWMFDRWLSPSGNFDSHLSISAKLNIH